MVRTRAQAAAQQGLPPPASKGKQPQGIQPRTKRTKGNSPRPSTDNETPSLQNLPSPVQNRGRKRKRSTEGALQPKPDPSHKRQRTSTPPADNTFGGSATGTGALEQIDPIAFWAKEGHWPEQGRWPKNWPSKTVPTMQRLLARKKSPSNSRQRSEPTTSMTPSSPKSRDEKSAAYRDKRYETMLGVKGSYMTKAPSGLPAASQAICRSLLEKIQPVPADTLFRDDIFEETCQKIQDKDEARVIHDISRLIVPSAETLAIFGAKHLNILIESVNEGWNNSIPFISTYPQPNYSVGFKRDAFTAEELRKLSPFIGDFIAGDKSFFMATYYMYFPFLTCEVKCSTTALDIADRQNAHSMTLAVRAIVELFRAVKREDEVNRQILAFSISHDHRSVRIYGHYPVISGKDTTYYRHPIHTFDFTALDGRDKWTAYQFTRNVYDTWMPAHFKNIRSAIDQLLPSNDIPPLSKSTELSQDLENVIQSDA